MPVFGNYPAAVTLAPGDVFLIQQASSATVKTIAAEDVEAAFALPSLSGILPLAKGGTGRALASPGQDAMLFWDNGNTRFDFLTVGSGLQIVGSVLSVITSGGGGSGGAPVGATYITKVPNVELTGALALSTLANGLLKNTTTTGELTIAVAGTDYAVGPNSSTDTALVRFNGTGGGTLKNSNVTLADAGTTLAFSGAAGLTAGGSNQNVSLVPSGTGIVQLQAGVKTSDPSGAAGVFRIGKITTGSVALDTTRYLQVSIDGGLYKILIAS